MPIPMNITHAAPGRLNCSHCGGKVTVPAGHSRPKIRCDACGYYVSVPPEMRSDVAPADDLPVIAPAAEEKPRRRKPEVEDDDEDDAPRARRRRDEDEDEEDDRPRRKAAPPPPPIEPQRKAKKPTAKARANPNPRDNRPDFQIADDAPLGPNLLDGTQEEDDDKPYAVPGDGTKGCPECNVRLPLDATMCVHCGLDFRSKKKPKKEFQPISREWEPRLTLKTRLQILAGLQVMNVILMLLIANVSSLERGVVSLVFQCGLQAFLIGSYQKLGVRRTAKGQTTLTKYWRLAFVPMPPQEIDWKDSHGVGTISTHSMGFLEWATFIYLLLLGVVPGIVFYFVVLNPVRYDIAICDTYGSLDEVIFRTTSQDQADEVGEVISNATGLQYRRVM